MFNSQTYDPLAETIAGLMEKRGSICLDTDKKQPKGAYAMALWPDFDMHAHSTMSAAVTRLQTAFHTDGMKGCPGMTKLTSSLASIGNIVARYANTYDYNDEANKETAFQIGGFYIEGLVLNHFIDITRISPLYAPGDNRTPYMIVALDKWKELEGIIMPNLTTNRSGMSLEPYADTTSLYNPLSGRPVVKRLHDESVFNQMLGTDFLSGIDGIQQTGWCINKDVHKVVMEHAWDDAYGPIPTTGNKAVADKALKEVKTELKRKNRGVSNKYDEAFKEHEWVAGLWAEKRSALKKRSSVSERQFCLTKACVFAEAPSMYYPAEADYRGRAYYGEPTMNYQSNDLPKGLLQFSEAKLLTARGFHWLHVHTASCFNQSFSMDEVKDIGWSIKDYVAHLNDRGLEDISVDKMSLTDRAEWSRQNLDLIRDVATNGIIHPGAEKPIMFLAACFDLVAAYDAFERDEEYYSRLPIAIDGQNNGAQHAAAINKDTATAEQVGIIPTELPTDLYVNVGKKMVDRMPDFFAERNMPMKDIRKNISKRATMVRQYSAGQSSISENMHADCYKNGATEKYDISALDCNTLAGIAIEAIDDVCPANTKLRSFLRALVKFELGTFEYQDSDGVSAVDRRKEVAKERKILHKAKKGHVEGSDEHNKILTRLEELTVQMSGYTNNLIWGNGSSTVDWKNPAGFEISSKHFHKNKDNVRVTICGKQYKAIIQYDSDAPDTSKHDRAIAANMTHSLDSAHLSIIVARWFAEGYTSFGAVHDSFSVHASDVDYLQVVAKETFKKMYDVPNFYEIIVDSVLTSREGFDTEFPELGDLDINCIDDSDYFFC